MKTINAIDFATIRAARSLMTAEEAALALELGLEAEKGSQATDIAFWTLIHQVLADPERRKNGNSPAGAP